MVEALTGEAADDPRIVDFIAERTGQGRAAVRVVPLAGDASTRRYFRIVDSACATRVLALYPNPFVAETMPFLIVGRLMEQWGLPVPRVLDHDGARGIVIVEDLGDVTLQGGLAVADDGRRDALYREALNQLVALQKASVETPVEAECFRLAFDEEKLSWELRFFAQHFIEGLRGRRLTDADRASLDHGFERLSAEVASWPRVLCHRDFHSRNLMLHDDVLRWIDFQDARMGPATYDLASLLRDSYVDLPEDFVAAHAAEFRARALPREEPEVFRRRFELVSVQRNLKALGTFGYMATARGNRLYEAHIPRTLATARRNLLRHPDLASLHRVLARYIDELA